MEVGQERQRFIGIKATCEIAGFSKSTILRKIAAGTFPAPAIRNRNVVRFDAAQVFQWRDEILRQRDERLKARAAPQSAAA